MPAPHLIPGVDIHQPGPTIKAPTMDPQLRSQLEKAVTRRLAIPMTSRNHDRIRPTTLVTARDGQHRIVPHPVEPQDQAGSMFRTGTVGERNLRPPDFARLWPAGWGRSSRAPRTPRRQQFDQPGHQGTDHRDNQDHADQDHHRGILGASEHRHPCPVGNPTATGRFDAKAQPIEELYSAI